jgi:hypothetical protein
MNLILIHLGEDNFPLYIFDTLYQIRRFYNGKLFIIVSNNIKKQYEEKLYSFNCSIIPSEDLENYNKNLEFKKTSFWNDGFWKFTLQRFIFLEALVHELSLTDIIHIENDVVIYENLELLESKLQTKYSNSIAINPCGPDHAAGAFIYSPNLENINNLNNMFLQYVSKGEENLKKELKYGHVSEMVLMNHFQKIVPEKIKYLPLLPEGRYSDNIETFDSIFDCASWGQYLGGTPGNIPNPGCMFQHHWVGQELLKNKYNVIWKIDSSNRRIPYILNQQTKKETKMNNLHIHCKRFYLKI